GLQGKRWKQRTAAVGGSGTVLRLLPALSGAWHLASVLEGEPSTFAIQRSQMRVHVCCNAKTIDRNALPREMAAKGSAAMSSSPTARHAQPAKQVRSQRNLERIVNAAETVLSRDGWEVFTMKAVADEAGASIGGIYRRFANKEQLLRAIKDNVLTRAD